MGILPLFAVHRDFDPYSDRINKSAAIFSLIRRKIAALLLIGWSTRQNCGVPQFMAKMAMPCECRRFGLAAYSALSARPELENWSIA